MEQQLNEILVRQESLARQIEAIKNVLLNFKNVYIETADGSQQGLIMFGVQKADPQPNNVTEVS